MTSLSTGRVTAIKGRSLSAEWRQVAPAEFHPLTAQTTAVFSTSSLQLSTNLWATRIARYHFKLLLFGLYGLPPPQSDFENPDLQPQSGTSRGRHSRLRCARGTNSPGPRMREPALKRFQTFNRPKPLSRPEFRLSFAKYEASLHPTTSNHQLQSAGLLLNHKPTIKEFAIPGG